MAHIRDEPASAHWLHPDELRRARFTYSRGSILLGAAKDKLIGIEDDRHVVTIAGSRAGKSRTSLIPNLRTWPGSAMVIDPKGELAANTAQHRADMGQRVCILDPFGEVEGEAARFRARFNPLAELLSYPSRTHVDDAALLADSLVVGNDGGNADHWITSARNLIHGLLLERMAKGSDPTLIDLRNRLSLPFAGKGSMTLMDLFGLMRDLPDYDGVIANIGGSYQGKPKGEAGSIISTAIEQTAFLRSSELADCLSASDFALGDLKRENMTVYLVLPASRMATHFRWLRVILTLAMAALERVKSREGEPPVLFVLEEFPTLGHMRQIEAAAGLMAGYGVKLWTVIQDLSQLKAQYPKSWETFLGNAGIVEAFGNADTTTTDYLSKRLGMTLSKVIQTDSLSINAQRDGQSGEREVIQSSPLLAPFEITRQFARDKGRKLILTPEDAPFIVKRIAPDDPRLAAHSGPPSAKPSAETEKQDSRFTASGLPRYAYGDPRNSRIK